MRKIAAALLMAGGLAVAGQASAHDGGDVVGALIGGALIGAVVSSALTPAPVVAYQAPVYAPAPAAYVAPAYQPQAYTPPPGYCYSPYQGGYVACTAAGCPVWLRAASAATSGLVRQRVIASVTRSSMGYARGLRSGTKV